MGTQDQEAEDGDSGSGGGGWGLRIRRMRMETQDQETEDGDSGSQDIGTIPSLPRSHQSSSEEVFDTQDSRLLQPNPGCVQHLPNSQGLQSAKSHIPRPWLENLSPSTSTDS